MPLILSEIALLILSLLLVCFSQSALELAAMALPIERKTILWQIGERLCEVGVSLETVFGGAQDVEGALIDDRIFVVQSRPQP